MVGEVAGGAPKYCGQCGKPMAADATFCPSCGAAQMPGVERESFAGANVGTSSFSLPNEGYDDNGYARAPRSDYMQATQVRTVVGGRSKVAAGLFAIFLGGLGIHKFYLGQVGQGILYLLFCWTFIPAIVGFIEGIIYLTMSDEAFTLKHNMR